MQRLVVMVSDLVLLKGCYFINLANLPSFQKKIYKSNR